MVDEKTRDFIHTTIRKYIPDQEYKIFIFGSHATGYARRYSDIDVGIMGPSSVASTTMSKIRDAFDESMTPYVIDPVDFVHAGESFRNLALKHTMQL